MRRQLAMAALGVLLPSALLAQQPQQPMQPGIVVVSSQICAADKLEQFNQFWKQTAGPVLDDLVRQGKLTSWGVLEHAWGDEWNSVIYYTARDLNAFNGAWNDFFARLAQREPAVMQRFAGWCSAHKDNIYSVVATNTVQPPRMP